MNKFLLALLCCSSVPAISDTCHHSGVKGYDGRSTYYEYGDCGGSGNKYGSYVPMSSADIAAMAKRVEAFYAAAALRAQREASFYNNIGGKARSGVRYGASMELGQDFDLSTLYRFKNADIPESQKQTIRADLNRTITSGKLLETYGNQGYEDAKNTATWAAKDPETRWKTCEVASQLVRAYVFGDFIKAEQKNPTKGLAIAQTGYQEHCGGTSYWLGRIYEEGDTLISGFDKNTIAPQVILNNGDGLAFQLEKSLEKIYDVAILNGYTPAYERMAELYRLGGPARFLGKKYTVFVGWMQGGWMKYLYWNDDPDHTRMYLMKTQYMKCLQADPTNLVCARGMRSISADATADTTYHYTNADAELAAFYDSYVKKLESHQ